MEMKEQKPWYHGVKWSVNIDSIVQRLFQYPDVCIAEFRLRGDKKKFAKLIAAAPETATQRDELLEALKEIFNAETHILHVDYDHGGNYVYADVVRIDDEAFNKARAAIARATGVSS